LTKAISDVGKGLHGSLFPTLFLHMHLLFGKILCSQMEAKAKQDKVLEIKRLTTAIAALRSEMNKYEEQLEDCRWVASLVFSVDSYACQ